MTEKKSGGRTEFSGVWIEQKICDLLKNGNFFLKDNIPSSSPLAYTMFAGIGTSYINY